MVDDARAVEVMTGGDFDPARELLLAEPAPIALPGTPVDGRVAWIERRPNRLVLGVGAGPNALLVLSEKWFPAVACRR